MNAPNVLFSRKPVFPTLYFRPKVEVMTRCPARFFRRKRFPRPDTAKSALSHVLRPSQRWSARILIGPLYFWLLLLSSDSPLAQSLFNVKAQKQLFPPENQAVTVTPPAFSWVPGSGVGEYTLQLSPSPDFLPKRTETWTGIRRPAFVPSHPLASGKWYWRVGVQGENRFGPTHSFIVPKNTKPFPFPDWEKVIRRTPRRHPRLFFPGARLAQAKRWAKTDWKTDLDKLESRCLKEMGSPLPPEPGPPPPPIALGPWSVQVIQTTRPPLDLMENCALLYLLRGNQRLGLEARRILLHFFSWDPDGPTSQSSFDEPGMWMMMRGVRTYDWTFDLFSPTERDRIEKVMKRRARQFLERLQALPFETNPFSSHAGRLPGFLGECALAFAGEWPEARPWLEYATLLFFTSYPAWGGDEGGWQEGPHYWNAYMSFALHYIVALRNATGVNLARKPFFAQTPFYALYTAPPYRQFSPFGDTSERTSFGSVMYAFSSLLRNPHLRWYAEHEHTAFGSDLLSLATWNPGLTARTPIELPPARLFSDVGLASIHTALGDGEQDIHFLLRSSPYGSVSHGHADQNAFALEAFGRGLAIATGYYPWYGSPHHDRWTRSTRAVNSLLVDGEGQAARSWKAQGRITAFASTDGYDYVAGEAASAYAGKLKRFRRQVVHLRPGVFVLLDEVQAKEPARFQWLLHACHEMQVREGERRILVRNDPAAMEVILLEPGELTFTQTNRYMPEPELPPGSWENTWHLQAETVPRSSTGRFLAVLLVHRVGEEQNMPQVSPLIATGGSGAILRYPSGKTDLVLFRTGPEVRGIQHEGIQTSAEVYAEGRDETGALCRKFTFPQNEGRDETR